MKHFDFVITGSDKAISESCATAPGDKRVCTHLIMSGTLNGPFAL